jgi:hypothetical protein
LAQAAAVEAVAVLATITADQVLAAVQHLLFQVDSQDIMPELLVEMLEAAVAQLKVLLALAVVVEIQALLVVVKTVVMVEVIQRPHPPEVLLVAAAAATTATKVAAAVVVELDIWAAVAAVEIMLALMALEVVVVEAVQVMWEAVSLY